MTTTPPGYCPECFQRELKTLLINGKHCLQCGFTQKLTTKQRIAAGLLTVSHAPACNAMPQLNAVIERFKLTLPRNAAEWRTCWNFDRKDHPIGSHAQLYSQIKLLCTDGVVAFAVLGDDTTLTFIQLSAFEERAEDKPERKGQARKGKSERETKAHAKRLALAEED